MKSVKVDDSNWKKLMELKLNNKYTSLNEVIFYLLKRELK